MTGKNTSWPSERILRVMIYQVEGNLPMDVPALKKGRERQKESSPPRVEDAYLMRVVMLNVPT